MHWKVVGKCVHKLNADGSVGEKVKCHDTPAEAAAHMKALYANVKESEARAGYFAFLSNLAESELDSAEFVARGVTLIKPGFSTNTDKAGRPRYYPADTLRQAARVFEGTRAYANHPRRSDEKELPERDVRDIVGYYQNVKAADDGRLRGDFRVVGAAREWLWPLITETSRKPDLVELSINALGNTKLGEVEGRKSIVVESIIGANSVDVVTTGAAGGSFTGALLASDPDGWTGDLLAAMSFEQWRETRPDYIERLKSEWKTVREMEALKTVKSKLAESQNEITRLKETGRAEADELAQLRHAAHADRLLNSSTLPYKLRYEIREAVIAQADEGGMTGVIAKATEAYAKSKPVVPVSGAGQRNAPPQKEVKLPNPVTQIFGISESLMALPGENAEEYKQRRQQQNLRG